MFVGGASFLSYLVSEGKPELKTSPTPTSH
jgi:hypothetical protein